MLQDNKNAVRPQCRHSHSAKTVGLAEQLVDKRQNPNRQMRMAEECATAFCIRIFSMWGTSKQTVR